MTARRSDHRYVQARLTLPQAEALLEAVAAGLEDGDMEPRRRVVLERAHDEVREALNAYRAWWGR